MAISTREIRQADSIGEKEKQKTRNPPTGTQNMGEIGRIIGAIMRPPEEEREETTEEEPPA